MANTSSAVTKNKEEAIRHEVTVEKAQGRTAVEIAEKVAEKRRALGRGLESLLPSAQRAQTGRAGGSGTAPAQAKAVIENRRLEVVQGASAEAHVAPSPEVVPEMHAADSGAASAPTPAPGSSSTSSSAAVDGQEVVFLPIDLIDKSPHQTRTGFHDSALRELANTIRVLGVLQPVVVRPGKEGRYTLVLGERRLKASRLAELKTIPAVVKRVSEQQAAEMTLVENLQRQDLNPVEQADAFRRLSQEFNLTQEEIGARVGMSREAVANYMRLFSLPEGVLEALIGGRLTFSHARVLLQLSGQVQQWMYGKKAIEEGMSVAKLQALVTGRFGGPEEKSEKTGGGARWVDPNVKAAQRSLEEVLGMRVRIRDRQGRGKIMIDYSTIDDFDRVVRMLSGR